MTWFIFSTKNPSLFDLIFLFLKLSSAGKRELFLLLSCPPFRIEMYLSSLTYYRVAAAAAAVMYRVTMTNVAEPPGHSGMRVSRVQHITGSKEYKENDKFFFFAPTRRRTPSKRERGGTIRGGTTQKRKPAGDDTLMIRKKRKKK